MEETLSLRPIAHLYNDLPEKFGVPRQSGLVALPGRIVFLPEYRSAEALRGLEGFSHLWLLWVFSEAMRDTWSPTVRPPRLGGNRRMGVFATRSPFRPNPIGLSAVRLVRIERSAADGPVLHVSGADLKNGTPIVDLKPYLPYADCLPEASGGFAPAPDGTLPVEIPPALEALVPPGKRAVLRALLAQDPRPPYQNDPARVYGMPFAGLDVRFTVSESGVLTVCAVEPKE